MRLDKFLSNMGIATRSESGKAAKRGGITVNGVVCLRADTQIDPCCDVVSFFGKVIKYQQFRYIMLNKPEGYVSATEDGRDKTVLELLPEEYRKFNLFPCGRLDKYTVGLMLLTDDGELAHKLLSPKHHVSKKYSYKSELPLSDADKKRLEEGTVIDGGYKTKPSVIELLEDRKSGTITLTEGKYHQIKQMFDSVKNKITFLERITFGPLSLDENLERGEWRELTDDEISVLKAAT